MHFAPTAKGKYKRRIVRLGIFSEAQFWMVTAILGKIFGKLKEDALNSVHMDFFFLDFLILIGLGNVSSFKTNILP